MRVFCSIAGAFLLLCVSSQAAAQEEKPVNPASIGETPLSLFGGDASRRLIINGFGVGSYSYDFNTNDNSFSPDALAVSFYKSISDSLNVFAQVTTAREAASVFLADPSGPGDVSTDIDNIQVQWIASPQKGLDITFGKFDSPLAIERDDAPLNFQATSSFTFDFARPVKFTGIQAHEAFSPHFEGWAIVANGWDQDTDNNKAKTGALYAMWSPSLAAHIGLGVIHGAEKDNRTGDPRTTVVATLLFQPMERWIVGSELVAGREPDSAENGGTAEWYADVFFTHYRFGPHWAVTLRTEDLDDRDGSRTGKSQVLRSITLSPQYLVGGGFYGIFRYLDRTSLRLPELALRLDLRYDRSSESVFRSRVEGIGRRDHTSATFQTVFLF